MAVQFLLSGRAAVPKRYTNHQLRGHSFRARVLYFGYSRRDELPLHFPQNSKGARAGNGSLQRSDDK